MTDTGFSLTDSASFCLASMAPPLLARGVGGLLLPISALGEDSGVQRYYYYYRCEPIMKVLDEKSFEV